MATQQVNERLAALTTAGTSVWLDQIGQCARAGKTTREIFQEMAIKDIQDGCDVLRSVYDETNGYDGYVSFEVDPDIAFDTNKTMEQARDYWQRVDRPN